MKKKYLSGLMTKKKNNLLKKKKKVYQIMHHSGKDGV
jgi:hypothetical protein